MIRGITFDEQVFRSEDFAHYMNFFLGDSSGITKGCSITNDGKNVTIGRGYFFVKGRFLQVEDPEVISGSMFSSGYNRIVYEIDLSKENTEVDFLQGYVKILNTSALTQENLDGDGKVYQFPFCHFNWDGTISSFVIDAPTLALDNIMAQIEANFETVKNEFETWFGNEQDDMSAWVAQQKSTLTVWTNQQKAAFESFLTAQENTINNNVKKTSDIVDSLEADGFEKKASYYSTTMTASKWSGGKYSFESSYPFAEYDIEIQPSDACTADQFNAWCEAKIVGSATSNTAKALGDIPTVNIPIILKAVKKYA